LPTGKCLIEIDVPSPSTLKWGILCVRILGTHNDYFEETEQELDILYMLSKAARAAKAQYLKISDKESVSQLFNKFVNILTYRPALPSRISNPTMPEFTLSPAPEADGTWLWLLVENIYILK
jgi:hypothetical protein